MKLFVIFSFCCVLALGFPVDEPTFRILDGAPTAIEKHPYQVALEGFIEGEQIFICGGSILNKDTIVTAAHCVDELLDYKPYITVRVGSTYIFKGGEKYKVANIFVHEKYNDESLENDVAVLKLDRPLTFSNKMQVVQARFLAVTSDLHETMFNEFSCARILAARIAPSKTGLTDNAGFTLVQPIELQPEHSPVPEGTEVVLSGWGLVDVHNKIYPENLRTAKMHVVSNAYCELVYSLELLWFVPITDDMLCAEDDYTLVTSGDSGGPLVANGKLVGIVSWGIADIIGMPAVFANVSTLHSFIAQYL